MGKPDLRSYRSYLRILRLFAAIVLCALLRPCVPAGAQELPSQAPAASFEGLPGERVLCGSPAPGALITPKSPERRVDPKYSQSYAAVCDAYAGADIGPGGKPGSFRRKFEVCGPDAASLPTVQRVARQLLTLYGEVHSRLRLDHSLADGTVHVWLTRQSGAGASSDAGGEQFKDQIYIYDLYAERRPIEWLRETAHEYGHFILPGVSGFKEPENWANGILGERLMLRWLRDDLRTERIRPDDAPLASAAEIDEYVSKQVDPLLRRIAAEGTDDRAIARKDARGMDAYTGFAVYIDAVYGDAGLLAAMTYSAPSQAQSFVLAPDFLRGALASLQAASEILIGPPFTDRERETFMVYLPRGDYIVSADPDLRSWDFGSERGVHVLSKTSLIVASGDWRMVTLTLRKTGAPTRLRLQRRGSEVQ
jgi:hypothetical protein